MRSKNLAFVASVSCLLSACAFSDIPVTLPVRPLPQTIPGGKNRQVIVAIPFLDGRETKRCGMQKNGYNMDTADAVCQSDPGVWLGETLARELKLSGFEVVDAKAAHKPGAMRIDGTVRKLFIEPVIGAWSGSLEADLFVNLRVTSETGLEAERNFLLKGWQGGRIISTASAYNEALDRATQAAVQEMVTSIVEIMNQYPQLGSRDTEILWLSDAGGAR